MKALVKARAEPGIWMEDVPTPIVGHNDVLIRVKKTAICGTDIHIYNWNDWAQNNVSVPMIVGHEFAGEVVELGSDVKSVTLGQRVSAEGHITCGHCRNCRAGRRHLCRNTIGIGVHRAGAFAEYIAVPAGNVCPLPDAITDDFGAILDPLGNAAHTALSFDLVGEDVLITGAGPIGIMAVVIAKQVGARNVVITDVNAYRLTLAKEMGADMAIDPNQVTLKEVMKTLRMTEGFDVGLEMSGVAAAFQDMLEHLNHGARVALLGLLPESMSINWNHVIFKGLEIHGIYGRKMFETWYKIIALLEAGLPLAPIITHRLPVDDFQAGFEVMRVGASGKVILDWT